MNSLRIAGSRSGSMPFEKYRAFEPIQLPDRIWPSNQLTSAPIWCSVDLRDGNQALVEPMDVDEKLRLYELLVEIGFVEIEAGFPAASQPDFDFLRRIIDNGLVPDDVTVQVLCQAREELIQRTVEALDGAPNAIFHLYNSTSTLQREVVFQMDRSQIVDLAVSGTELVREVTKDLHGTNIRFEYSPESFTGTELDFSVEICERVSEAWGATEDEPIIINLPSTVEMATPNVYADQIEYFCRNYQYRDAAIVSLHTHNDRGTGIAATELALMAGAERVEGTLFGNGERTGNCDLVSVAMNLFSQGVDPELDLRDMSKIRTTVEEVNKIPVHVRQPYAGDLVFTAFSGSHQDAIRKGIAKRPDDHWEVPYLPIDPADVGASYKESVRVNSQSGKGGVGFVLEENYGILLPREMLVEFSKKVQRLTEEAHGELIPRTIVRALVDEYLHREGLYKLVDYDLANLDDGKTECKMVVNIGENRVEMTGVGSGPIEAFVTGLVESLNEPLDILDFHEHAIISDGEVGSDASAIGIVAIGFGTGSCYGIGFSQNTVTASFLAIISAMNRRWKIADN